MPGGSKINPFRYPFFFWVEHSKTNKQHTYMHRGHKCFINMFYSIRLNSIMRIFSSIIHRSDINRMSGDGDDLESICSNSGIPAHIFSTTVGTGWSTSTIAMGFADVSEFDQDATLRDLGIIDDVS